MQSWLRMSRPWRLSPIFWQREFGSLGGQRERGLEGVIWIQAEMRNRAVLGQEGSPRLAKQHNRERSLRRIYRQAGRHQAGLRGNGPKESPAWSTADAAAAPSLHLHYLYFSISASQLICEQEWPVPPSHVPAAHS